MRDIIIWTDKYHGVRDFGEYWDAHQVGEERAEDFDSAMRQHIAKQKDASYYRKDENTGEWYCWGFRMFEG